MDTLDELALANAAGRQALDAEAGNRRESIAGRARALTVLLISAVALHRDELARVLARSDRLRIIGTTGPHRDAIATIQQLRPDVVLLDFSLQRALSFARSLTLAIPETKVVVLGVEDVEDEVIACAERGIVGYAPHRGRDERRGLIGVQQPGQ